MQADFWLTKWETNDIAFHEAAANPALLKHLPQLSLAKGSRIFLPLCGKTLDIAWLLKNGYHVAGAELSPLAIADLFRGLGIEPKIQKGDSVDHYFAPEIDIFVGDIFQLTGEMLGRVDAVYDRAALVALPKDMRLRYAAHLTAITKTAPQLLLTFEYDQRLMEGPPFSIGREAVNRRYANHYDIKLLASTEIPGGLKGQCAAKEHVWLLTRD